MEWLRGDVVAGLTVWAVLVPEALAYASIAGVSPVVGLYAAPGALIMYAAFGSSRHLVTGPMSATAALSAAAVAEFATAGSAAFVTLTTTLAITAGIVGILAALLRLGALANFISEPVLKGFIIGLALTIIVGQLPKLFGVEGGEGDFFDKIWDLLSQLGDTSGWTLAVGTIGLLTVLLLRRYVPLAPGSLVAVALGIGATKLLDLESKGVEIVGEIQSGLPTLGLPDGMEANDLLDLAPSAIGILLVGFAEGLGAAKNYAAKNGYEIEANRELLGFGAANIASGLSSGMVVNGSLSKTAVNGAAGANSQLSGLVVAALTVVTLLFLTGLFEQLPEATLAAVVIAAVLELVDLEALRRLYRVQSARLGRVLGPAARTDFLAAIAAMAGVLVFDTLPGLFIGIGVSMLLLLYRASRPRISELGRVPGTAQFTDVSTHPDNERVPGLVIVRVESGLFFANAEHVRDEIGRLAAQDGVRAVLLDAETIAFVDLTGVKMLVELHHALRGSGKRLLLARDIGQVRDVLRASGEASDLEVYPTVSEAVRTFTGSEQPDVLEEGSTDG
ncbi:MAG: SulP family inorganic anion transporter [Actinobacteria bacterium]|nr:SulP family inorganic anion transporter [Actinomycetota bacterium]